MKNDAMTLVKETSPVKLSRSKTLRTDLTDQMNTFESLLIQHSAAVDQSSEMASMLKMLQANFKQVQMSASRVMDNMSSPGKSPKRKSPAKSKPVDENVVMQECQVIAMSFSSPTKKSAKAPCAENEKNQNSTENGMRRSQQRKRLSLELDDESNDSSIDQNYLQAPTQNSSEDDANLSPSKRAGRNCPKSPVKRMRKLEEQAEQQEGHVDVETAYRTSPEKVIKLCTVEPPVEEEITKDEVAAEVKEEPKADEPCEAELVKALFATQSQEVVQTALQAQQAEQRIKIDSILDVDSNVINYGQFICGKILGSTLLLSNLTGKEQGIDLNISRQTTFDCNTIFG